MTNKNKGVALVQVLLITSMILLLVVQLSKGAKRQVKTAQLNKNKIEALINMKTALEETKFSLLSTENVEGRAFYGQATSKGEVKIKVQDEAGLLSLPYGSDQIASYLGVPENDAKIQSLLKWQGLDNESATKNDQFRNGFLQYTKEVYAIPSWASVPSIDEVSSYIPTPFFNGMSAPFEVLEKIYGNDKASMLEELRISGNIAGAQSILRSIDLDAVTEPSNVFRIQVEQEVSDTTIKRAIKVQFNLDSSLVIQSIGY